MMSKTIKYGILFVVAIFLASTFILRINMTNIKRYKIDRVYNKYDDYNSLLIYGCNAFISDDELRIYRTIPSVPPIIPMVNEVIVDNNVKNYIEASKLSGFIFQKVKYEKVIRIDWFDWKNTREIPEIPASGSPFGFFTEMPMAEEKDHPLLWRLVTYTDGNEDLALRNGNITFSEKAVSILGKIESPSVFSIWQK